jgi:HSP20 family protein
MCKVNSVLYQAQRAPASNRNEPARNTHWVPNTDVFVTEGSLVINVELAGLRREDLELSFDGNRLRISGQRPDICRPGKCKFLVMEIHYGPFECVIEVPSGYDLTQARAIYQSGFLRVDIPQTHETPPSKRIPVSVATA